MAKQAGWRVGQFFRAKREISRTRARTIRTYKKKLTGACVSSGGVLLRCFLCLWRVNFFRVSINSVSALQNQSIIQKTKKENNSSWPRHRPWLRGFLLTHSVARCAHALTHIARCVRTCVLASVTHLGLVHVSASFVKTGQSNFEHEDCKKCCLKQFP